MASTRSKTRARWLAPVTAAVVVTGASAAFAVTASADEPAPTPTELLTAVQQPTVTSLSGTVVTTGNLGLPAVPAGLADVGPFSLNDDEVSADVWVDGENKQRITTGVGDNEVSAIRSGESAWLWSAADSSAVRLIPGDFDRPKPVPGTPAEMAQKLLAEVEPTTAVTVADGDPVAGRQVFDLVFAPNDPQTRVERIVVAVDAQTSVPLEVEVFSTELTEAAFTSGFSNLDYAVPAPEVFEFTPPADAEVTARTVEPKGDKPDLDAEMIGDGWSAVVLGSFDLSKAASELAQTGQSTTDPQMRAAATEALVTYMSLPTVSGDWGSGRVVSGTLFSIIITDNGEYAAGAVAPETLVGVLADR